MSPVERLPLLTEQPLSHYECLNFECCKLEGGPLPEFVFYSAELLDIWITASLTATPFGTKGSLEAGCSLCVDNSECLWLQIRLKSPILTSDTEYAIVFSGNCRSLSRLKDIDIQDIYWKRDPVFGFCWDTQYPGCMQVASRIELAAFSGAPFDECPTVNRVAEITDDAISRALAVVRFASEDIPSRS
jgi:hypothetical protein